MQFKCILLLRASHLKSSTAHRPLFMFMRNNYNNNFGKLVGFWIRALCCSAASSHISIQNIILWSVFGYIISCCFENSHRILSTCLFLASIMLHLNVAFLERVSRETRRQHVVGNRKLCVYWKHPVFASLSIVFHLSNIYSQSLASLCRLRFFFYLSFMFTSYKPSQFSTSASIQIFTLYVYIIIIYNATSDE